MPCSDSSSSVALKIDPQDRFISFEYAKITCGREIEGKTGLNQFLVGRNLIDILSISFETIVKALKVTEEDAQFILCMEFDALRSAIAQYLGIDDVEYDADRCQITSIEHTEREIEVAQVILPPKQLPKILPCRLADELNSN